ncbi:MAG: hypothetical protein QM679_07235 [Patulibacter sp.]
MNPTSTSKRLAIVASAIAAAALTAPSAAVAAIAAPISTSPGSYEVMSCSLADGVNLSWTFETNAPEGIRFTDRCNSTLEDDADGFNTFAGALGIRTSFGASEMPVGTYGYLRFDVPDGLAITGLRAGVTGMVTDENWNGVLESSSGGYGYDNPYGKGGKPGAVSVPEAIDPIPPSRWLRLGVRCTTAPCLPGVKQHAVTRRLYGAGVRVADAVPPVVGLAGVASGVATVSGSDQTGIKRLELRVDGELVGTSEKACDYREVLPCQSPSGTVSESFTLPQLRYGNRTVTATAVDAANNSASTSTTINVPLPSTPTPTPSVATATPTTAPTPTPTPTASSTATPAPTSATAPRRSAALAVAAVTRTGTRVRVRGTVAAGCRSRITIRLTVAGRTRTVTLTAPASGRWGVLVKGVRRTGTITARVRAATSPSCQSATLTTRRSTS